MVARVQEAVAVAVMRKAGLIPLARYPGSKVKWQCLCLQCGKIVYPIYNSIQQGVGGCWKCGVEKSTNSRRTPSEIAERQLRVAGAEPDAKFPGLMAPWPSICSVCGERISPSLHNIRNGQGACKFCARRCVKPLVAAGKMMAAGARPQTAYPGSSEPWPCECLRCRRAIRPRYDSIIAGQSPCKYCSGNAVDVSEAEESMLEAGLRPRLPWPGSDIPWLCECLSCHRLVEPRYHHVRRGHSRCKYCAGHAVDPAEAIAVMRAADLEPNVAFPGADKPWQSTCKRCASSVQPRYSVVKTGIRGRCGCTNYGFDPTRPAAIYLVTSVQKGAIKVGVSNRERGRLAEHAKYGWLPFVIDERPCIWPVDTGLQALVIEKRILHWWRNDLGACAFVEQVQMPQRGATETASLGLVDPEATAHRVETLLSDK